MAAYSKWGIEFLDKIEECLLLHYGMALKKS